MATTITDEELRGVHERLKEIEAHEAMARACIADWYQAIMTLRHDVADMAVVTPGLTAQAQALEATDMAISAARLAIATARLTMPHGGLDTK